LQDAALACQGILGRAVAQLKGKSEEEQARETLTLRLADAVQRGSEGELFQETMALEKGGKDDLPLILDALETELTARMASVPDRRRLYRGVSLVRELKAAAALNANPGQVAGWLCAGMFTENESR
jgi:DNA polymerase-3 subunit delta'